MNIGNLRDLINIYSVTTGRDAKGSAVKIRTILNPDQPIRGSFRALPGKEVLLNDLQYNVRSGTLLTRYFPAADESQVIQINGGNHYEVVTFNHDDKHRSTLWALKLVKV